MKLLSAVACYFWSIVIFLTFLFTLFTLTLALTRPVHAQACAGGQVLPAGDAINQVNKCAIEKDIFDDKIFNLNQIAGTVDSFYNLLTGRSQLHPDTNNATAGTGALAASGKLVAALYGTPPVSGVYYFASEFQKFNPVQPVYAQTDTIGFGALAPVQKIWQVFRNASYVAFVIVFVVIGFMIMFRAHISPQAVATIQDSVPRIVIALILVTFSYALAGLMIDLMFLILNVIINLLKTSGLLGNADYVFKSNVFQVIWGSWKDIVGAVFDAISRIIGDLISLPLGLDKIFGFFGGGFAALIVGIALLFIMFRIFLMLLIAYVMIIILTMFAPFFFLIQALPGNNGAREWFKQMAANVAVFPTVALMFIFAGILGGISALGGGAPTGAEQQIGQFPLLAGNLEASAIKQLIAIGFLLMTPQAAELVKSFLGAKGPGGMNLGAAAMAGLGAGAAVAGAGLGAGRRAAWEMGPIGEYRKLRQARMGEARQRQVELESVKRGERGTTFYK